MDAPQAIPVPQETEFPKSRIVRQIRKVAVLLIAQGVFELAAPMCAFAALALFFWINPTPGSDGISGQSIDAAVLIIFGGLCLITVLAGFVHLLAGLANYRFGFRLLGILSFFAGFLSLSTVICGPTSVLLGIHGFFVYRKKATRKVFELVVSGQPIESIDDEFALKQSPRY